MFTTVLWLLILLRHNCILLFTKFLDFRFIISYQTSLVILYRQLWELMSIISSWISWKNFTIFFTLVVRPFSHCWLFKPCWMTFIMWEEQYYGCTAVIVNNNAFCRSVVTVLTCQTNPRNILKNLIKQIPHKYDIRFCRLYLIITLRLPFYTKIFQFISWDIFMFQYFRF